MSAVRKLNVVSTIKKQIKVKVRLRAKPRAKLDMHQLPFVGRDHVVHDDGCVCFWDVPLTGGYFGGTETGSAIACMYLAHIRRQMNGDKTYTLSLASILCALTQRVTKNPDEADSLRGQVVGFGSVIGRWLTAAVEQLGGNLEAAELKKLLGNANDGLDRDRATKRFDQLCESAGIGSDPEKI